MKKLIGILAVAMTVAMVGSAFAQVSNNGGTRNLSPGDTIQVGATSTATGGAGGAGGAGGSVGNISNNGGTHVQSNTQLNNQTSVNTLTQGQQQGQGQGQYQGQGQGQGQTYEGQQNTTVEVKTDVPRQAPPAIPAALAVSSLTCYGSWSIAASTPFGGVGAGFPTKDADCERARNALIFVNIGMKEVAIALLSQNEDNAKAMRVAGVAVPGEAKKLAMVAPAPAPSYAPASFAPSEPASVCGAGNHLSASGFCRTGNK